MGVVHLGDAMVVRRSGEGPDDAFSTWYRGARRQLLAAVTVNTGEGDLAGGAVDEACCRALHHWARVEHMDSPTGWAYRVAINHARRSLLRRRLEHRLRLSEPPRPVVDVARTVDVWRSVRLLPPRQREAIVLHYVLDLPEALIASSMRITRGAVSANLAKGLDRLAADLGSENPRSRDHG